MQSAIIIQGKFTSGRIAEYAPAALGTITQREGEDAKLCGLTRSLYRRLLALNMPAQTQRKQIASITLGSLTEKRIA
ncbi:MAG: hypothetical protein JSS87_10335 [Acidobacteria bacterium]|nr:hypothetical protein [Acidobacteriota bacterium]